MLEGSTWSDWGVQGSPSEILSPILSPMVENMTTLRRMPMDRFHNDEVAGANPACAISLAAQ
jgi:hypothetical protein